MGLLRFGVLLLPVLGAAPQAVAEVVLNGFRLAPASVSIDEILPGGPPRDGIPALVQPETLAPDEAPWGEEDRVIGVVRGTQARAYPLAILDWHELVNDTLGGEPILVTYCPLCGTGMVFDRRIEGQPRTFGVSGLLYRSDVLLYDRETESLWSQIASAAVTGPALGARLRLLRSTLTTWGEWNARHPQTTVLSPRTGHRRDYGRSPYAEYAGTERLMFPISFDRRYPPKTPTMGLRLDGHGARAYPASEILRAGGRVEEHLAGRRIVVSYDAGRRVFAIEAPDQVEVVEGYWFAWSAFHPESTVFVAPGAEVGSATATIPEP